MERVKTDHANIPQNVFELVLPNGFVSHLVLITLMNQSFSFGVGELRKKHKRLPTCANKLHVDK